MWYYTKKMNDWGPRGYNVFDCVIKKQARANSAPLRSVQLSG